MWSGILVGHHSNRPANPDHLRAIVRRFADTLAKAKASGYRALSLVLLLNMCEAAFTIILASPRGFCAGVRRALDLTELALTQLAPPIYCRKEIVHNNHLVNDFTARGIRFVNELHEVPNDAHVILSAHGVTPEVRDEARRRGLRTIDATCPFVTRVHSEVKRFARQGYTILLLGHKDHDEIIGIVGEAPEHVEVLEDLRDADSVMVPDPDKVAVMTQTTLSALDVEAMMAVLRQRFPKLALPRKKCICYATHNRQNAVQALAADCDLVLVLGARNSSNSNRLVEVAQACGANAQLVSALEDLRTLDLSDVRTVGITAGASTPEYFVQSVVEALEARGGDGGTTELSVAVEDVQFRLPGDQYPGQASSPQREP